LSGLSISILKKVAALTVDSLVRAQLQTYGIGVTLLAIALLIPIAEELIFRSILLDVFAGHLRFWVANLLQAVLFAALHADPLRLVAYTAMGLLSGRMRRASGGLFASILFHVANNTVAVLLLSSTGTPNALKPLATPPPDPELVACAKAEPKDLPNVAMTFNNLAWK